MREVDDDVIWNFAKERGFTVATKDADFRRLSEALGQPPKVILTTLGNGPTEEVEALLRQRHRDLLSFYNDMGRGFLELP